MNADAIDAILEKVRPTLKGDECAVMDVIQGASLIGESITQREIAKSKPWLGCHPKHEGHLPRTADTTLRRVRAIIRALRLAHGVPIISSKAGYRLPGGEDEAKAYLKRMEREAKARAWSSLETYRGMSKILGLKSTYFEGVEKLHAQLELFGKPPLQRGKVLEVGDHKTTLTVSGVKEPCPSCSGTGSLKGEADCPNCDGAGIIIHRPTPQTVKALAQVAEAVTKRAQKGT